MLVLIFLTFFVFLILWIGDFYITKKIVKKVGTKVEINILLRKILSFRGKFIWIFKAIELGLFLYLIYYIQTFSGEVSFYILLGYILFYTILVTNNSRVYFQVTRKASEAFMLMFLVISISLLGFIYLNFLMYSGLVMTYEELGKCQSNYKNVYWECYQKNVTSEVPKELEDIIGSFDISIPMP